MITKKKVFGFMAGALVSAAVTLMLTPQSGKRLRHKLRQKAVKLARLPGKRKP